MALYTITLGSSLVQYLTVSSVKRKTALETGWPQPPTPPVAHDPPAARVWAGGSPRAPGSTHTSRGARTRALRARGRPAPRSHSVAYRPFSRQLGKNQDHRQQKDQKKTAYFQKPKHHNTIPIQSGRESSSPPRAASSLRRNNADTGVESGSPEERCTIHPSTRLQRHHLKNAPSPSKRGRPLPGRPELGFLS